MSYVDETLLPGEKVEYRARVHWWIYLVPTLWTLLGTFLAAGGGGALLWRLGAAEPPSDGEKGGFWFLVVLGALICVYGTLRLLWVAIYDRTTELAVTTRRVVAKRGFVRRKTWELQRSKLESVEVHQSFWARVLGFGTLEVQGTGGGTEPIDMIRNPLAFRRAAFLEAQPDVGAEGAAPR